MMWEVRALRRAGATIVYGCVSHSGDSGSGSARKQSMARRLPSHASAARPRPPALQFYTQKRPYAGVPREAVSKSVLRGARPEFPPGPPFAYVQLASSCWAADPSARAAIADVITGLQGISAELLGPWQAA